jgi:pathogenesis-related protein 1
MAFHPRAAISVLSVLAGMTVLGQSAVPAAEAEEALAFHNKVRKGLGVPPLAWSDELSAYAQVWADYLASEGCRLEHRPRSGPWAQRHGENLFYGRGGRYTALTASQSWQSEAAEYRYRALSASNSARTGHYTQMVWRDTERMGMGQATCPDGAVIIVANYDPPGNVIGRYPY